MSTFELILVIITGFSFLVQMLFYGLVFSRLVFYRKPDAVEGDKPPVSVVIAARNEYHNLAKNLPLILQQNYPEFEVVVVNHASDDESAMYLKEIQQKDKRLKVVQIDRELNFFTGKKFPLSLGIKTAKNEVLLLTDADCTPAGDRWIESMVSHYSEETEIVIGFGPYKKAPGFTNRLVRYDTFMVAMQYLSFAMAGMPYMGVGRNLSYKRSTFFRNKGFTAHYKISSGDDDLFINQVANRKNTSVAVDSESFSYSEAKKTFAAWLKQKRRHLSTARNYKFKFKLLLGLFGLTQTGFYAGLVLMFSFSLLPLAIRGWSIIDIFAHLGSVSCVVTAIPIADQHFQ
ncbi:MAG: glycosyltransferase [bacterium]